MTEIKIGATQTGNNYSFKVVSPDELVSDKTMEVSMSDAMGQSVRGNDIFSDILYTLTGKSYSDFEEDYDTVIFPVAND